MALGAAAAIAPGKLLEMQILQPTPTLTGLVNPKLWGWSLAICVATKSPPADSKTLKYENHWVSFPSDTWIIPSLVGPVRQRNHKDWVITSHTRRGRTIKESFPPSRSYIQTWSKYQTIWVSSQFHAALYSSDSEREPCGCDIWLAEISQLEFRWAEKMHT